MILPLLRLSGRGRRKGRAGAVDEESGRAPGRGRPSEEAEYRA